jgi:hypothetical protein
MTRVFILPWSNSRNACPRRLRWPVLPGQKIGETKSYLPPFEILLKCRKLMLKECVKPLHRMPFTSGVVSALL